MKNIGKLTLILLIFTCFGPKSFAIQEQVELEQRSLNILTNKINAQNFHLKDSFTFEDKFINQVDLKLFVDLNNAMSVSSGEDLSSKFNFNAVEPGMVLHFKDNKSRVGIIYNVARQAHYNPFFEKFSALYFERDIAPHQKVVLGMHARAPIGYEGRISTTRIPLAMRSQISRTFGNTNAFGIENIGDYKYLNYTIGYYDGSRFLDKIFNGSEFIGNIEFKPLANTDGKYGDLRIGTSIDTGYRNGSFNVFGANVLYKYKKAFADFEYASANGSLSHHYVKDEADGFYTTVGYNITDKLQLVGRYDYFKNKTKNSASKEYTVGINYDIHSGFRLLANYSLVDSDAENAVGHRIYLGTRFYLTDFCNNL